MGPLLHRYGSDIRFGAWSNTRKIDHGKRRQVLVEAVQGTDHFSRIYR